MLQVDPRYNTDYLYFDEGPHKYTDTLGNEYLSVTTLIGNYHEKFDKKYWARIKAKEQGKTERQIIAEWDRINKEATTRGTAKHNAIEDAIKDVSKFKDAIKYLTTIESGRCVTVADIPNLIPKPLDIEKFKEATEYKYDEIYRVFDYYTQKGYTIYSEIGMFLIDYLISGTIDILCIKDDEFVILDWKTNRDGLIFESGYYKKDKTIIPNQLTNEWVPKDVRMLPPLGHLQDCNGMHYTMQLSLYAIGVEMILGIPCRGLGLCHIGSAWVLNSYGQPFRDVDGYHVDPDKPDTVKWYKINYRKADAIALLKDRYLQLKANSKQTDKQLKLDF